MKEFTMTHSKSFIAKTPEEYDEKYNSISDSLVEKGYQLHDDEPKESNNMYHIYYSYKIQVAESAREEYELRGERYYCKDCPFFKVSEDKRRKGAGCTRNVDERAVDYTPACNLFYDLYAKGEIEPRR